ncbi:MAG: hypothetical protein IT168_29720 [Bryobacterales bacterium]|nr:hypothetical protein [Bryobacterales bacterium]
MRQALRVSRRELMGGAVMAAAAGRALGEANGPITGENEYFWYREQPAGKYIDCQRGKKAFSYAEGKIFLSNDNGHTWGRSLEFADATKITFSHILKNGNVVFATGSKLYVSTDGLKSYREVKVKGLDGSDYVPHTPVNAELPGWYFHTLPGTVSWDIDGNEMMVWGNYCNVLGGAVPVNIYYSTDSGKTVKIAYSFGQNPFFTDTGKPGGGKDGKLLGDPNNKTIARHVHCVAYNPAERAFYATTGDGTRGFGHECHWLRGTYNAKSDKWAWDVIISDVSNSRYKCGGINFVDGKLYWISDSNGPKPYDRGVFVCDPKDLKDKSKHTNLFNPGVEAACMIIQDRTIIAAHCAPATPLNTGFIISNDMGKTWAQPDLKEFGKRSGTRFHEKNGEGWFRVDLRSGWIKQEQVVFIKPKPAKG